MILVGVLKVYITVSILYLTEIVQPVVQIICILFLRQP